MGRGMDDFGGKLRHAREGRGLSLREISTRTKISVAALEALERNDISRLPGGLFSRSIVRSYATEVGLNPDDTVREFLDRFEGEPQPRGPVAETFAGEIAFEREKRHAARVFLIAVAGMLMVAAVVGYVVLQTRPETETPHEAAVPGVLTPSPAAVPAVQADPVAPLPAAPAATGAAQAVAAGASGPMRIEIHATGECWVSASVDGQRVMAKVLQPGDRATLTVHESALLSVGNAGAFEFTIDGRPGRALGERGETRTARITRQTLASYLR
jgi:cytoskeletal protein RodZ